MGLTPRRSTRAQSRSCAARPCAPAARTSTRSAARRTPAASGSSRCARPSRRPAMAERRTEHLMGTAVTVEIRDRTVPHGAMEHAFAWLRWVDRRFSTYDDASDISRLNAGEIGLPDTHPVVQKVLAYCD